MSVGTVPPVVSAPLTLPTWAASKVPANTTNGDGERMTGFSLEPVVATKVRSRDVTYCFNPVRPVPVSCRIDTILAQDWNGIT
jgi:hypothetical protein